MQDDAMTTAVLIHPMTPQCVDVIALIRRDEDAAPTMTSIFRNAWRGRQSTATPNSRTRNYSADSTGSPAARTGTQHCHAARGRVCGCWGPIHKDALEQVQALHRIEEATDVEG
jgi:hypothetical protein